MQRFKKKTRIVAFLLDKSSNCFTPFIENSEGKYISPFHDVPIYANEAEVSIILPVVCQGLW